MSILENISDIDKIKEQLDSLKNRKIKAFFKGDHLRRLGFYKLLLSYLKRKNNNINDFFDVIIKNLDSRSKLDSLLTIKYREILKKENEPSMRELCRSMSKDLDAKNDFLETIRDYIPNDEYLAITSEKIADFSKGLTFAITLVENKIKTQELKEALYKKVMLWSFIAVVFHTVFAIMFYGDGSFFIKFDIETLPQKSFSERTLQEHVYMFYQSFRTSWWVWLLGIFLSKKTLDYVIDNWHERYVWIREGIFDYLPFFAGKKRSNQFLVLFSLYSRINNTDVYQILEDLKKHVEPYFQYQLDKILSNHSETANKAINTPYMGEIGLTIKELSEYDVLSNVIQNEFNRIQEGFFEKTNQIYQSIIGKVSYIAITTIALALTPPVMIIIDLLGSVSSTKG
jgi:hypothetical protein